MPNARATDPSTSWEAAMSISAEHLNKVQRHILNLLSAPMTDIQLVDEYRRWSSLIGEDFSSESGIRTRRAELVRRGLVVDTLVREKTPSGRNAIVWRSVNGAE